MTTSIDRPKANGLVSVIVPCLGSSATVRRCLAALFRHTKRPPWELIAVTRSGGDATSFYLSGLHDASTIPVVMVTDPAVKSLRHGWHRGLSVARGEHVVFLAPSVVVTDAWLEQLYALSQSNPSILLVGPMSNAAATPQRAECPQELTDSNCIDEFAKRWRTERRGKWFNVESIDSACLLAKRSFLDGTGGARPIRVMGMRSRRLALRARRMGGQLAVAYDLYIHRDHGEMRASVDPLVAAVSLPAPLIPEPRRCRVSLTMIVRNEESNLPTCLGSAADLFDEIVVVDTGSTDRTVEIARSFGARVFDFVWVDDFAAARNAALSRATGDYTFWLDADDVLDPPQRARLGRLLAALVPGDEAAYVVKCSCDSGPDGDGGQTVVDHVRLFPVREDVRWAYRVHEQILPALRRAGVPVRWTDLVVRHTGYTDAALRARKLDRDSTILEAEAEERPDDPFVLFNLGAIAVERGQWRVALEYLRRSLARSAHSDSITRKLHALIARSYQFLNEPEAALRSCLTGLADDPDDAELLFRRAMIHRQLGDPEQAEVCWRRVLTLSRPEQFSSVDQGIYGHLTRRNLAALARDRKDRDEEMRLWTAVLAECPGDLEALARLSEPDSQPDTQNSLDRSEKVVWLIPGSRRQVVPAHGEGDFDPYTLLASTWVERLQAKVIVELGVRLGVSTRALLAGARVVDGHVWGVDLWNHHGINDPHFTFLKEDAADVAYRWESIDLLHIDTDPHTEEQTMMWFQQYGAKCRAIALHDTHHPDFGVGAAVCKFVASEEGQWDVSEYWGNPSGWTVLVRRDTTNLAMKEIACG